MRRVGREAIVERRDACDSSVVGREVGDGGISAGRSLEGIAPCAAVDVAVVKMVSLDE